MAAPSKAKITRETADATPLLREAVRLAASDLHLKSGMPPMVRRRGELAPLPGYKPFSAFEVRELIFSMLEDARRKEWELNFELDLALEIRDLGRFRLNAYFDRTGPGAALRLIPTRIPELEDIGLSWQIKDHLMAPNGLILCTGPTGTGKSTTLACLANTILRERPCHVLTLEDPIEFVLSPGLGMVSQREVGRHTSSFAQALKRGLRQDPDVILVGEMRDPETIELALTAAETGHLVLASLHSPDAPGTIERILGAMPADRQAQSRMQLAATLRAILAQTLLPRKDGNGRVAAREIMLGNPAVAALIRENRTHQLYSQIETSRDQGMITMEKYLADLVLADVVDLADAERAAIRPLALEHLLEMEVGVGAKRR